MSKAKRKNLSPKIKSFQVKHKTGKLQFFINFFLQIIKLLLEKYSSLKFFFQNRK